VKEAQNTTMWFLSSPGWELNRRRIDSCSALTAPVEGPLACCGNRRAYRDLGAEDGAHVGRSVAGEHRRRTAGLWAQPACFIDVRAYYPLEVLHWRFFTWAARATRVLPNWPSNWCVVRSR